MKKLTKKKNNKLLLFLYVILMIASIGLLTSNYLKEDIRIEDVIQSTIYKPHQYQNNKSYLSSEKILEETLVYGESIINTLAVNEERNGSYVNFIVDSRILIDGKEYYLAMPCRSEHTYASDNLFQEFSYEYTPVFEKGTNNSITFKTLHANYKIQGSYYKEVNFNLKFQKIKVLKTNEELLEAMKTGERLIGITKINDIIIEYPIKTINFLDEEDVVWQVDTGPILFPINNSFEIAYIAFTGPDWADFVLRGGFGRYNQFTHLKTKNMIGVYEE